MPLQVKNQTGNAGKTNRMQGRSPEPTAPKADFSDSGPCARGSGSHLQRQGWQIGSRPLLRPIGPYAAETWWTGVGGVPTPPKTEDRPRFPSLQQNNAKALTAMSRKVRKTLLFAGHPSKCPKLPQTQAKDRRASTAGQLLTFTKWHVGFRRFRNAA